MGLNMQVKEKKKEENLSLQANSPSAIEEISPLLRKQSQLPCS
jgi:hypothetical protein